MPAGARQRHMPGVRDGGLTAATHIPQVPLLNSGEDALRRFYVELGKKFAIKPESVRCCTSSGCADMGRSCSARATLWSSARTRSWAPLSAAPTRSTSTSEGRHRPSLFASGPCITTIFSRSQFNSVGWAGLSISSNGGGSCHVRRVSPSSPLVCACIHSTMRVVCV